MITVLIGILGVTFGYILCAMFTVAKVSDLEAENMRLKREISRKNSGDNDDF